MPKTPPVLTVTLNPAIDLGLDAAEPGRGDFVKASGVRRAAGGKGVNVARALAALGIQSTACCVVGGPDAAVYLALLANAPFEVEPIRIAGPTRTNITINFEKRGRSIKINQQGPLVGKREWRAIITQLKPLFEGRQWVALAGSLAPGMPVDAYRQLTRLAHRTGVRVMLDCAGESLMQALAEKPNLIKPNRAVVAETFGMRCKTRREAIEGGHKLLAAGAQSVVISSGSGEILAFDEQEIWAARPAKIELARDKAMGAGDALGAGVLAGLITGLSFSETLRLGIASGTARAAGGAAEFPDIRKIERINSRIAIKRIQ